MDNEKEKKEKDSKKRGLSLRRKGNKSTKAKPVIGAPKPVPMPASMPGARLKQEYDISSGPNDVPPPPMPAMQNQKKMADLVKRRMSMRVPQPGQQQAGDVPPMPTMPSIPAMPSLPAGVGARLAAGGGATRPSRGPLGVDLASFREPVFNAEAFVQTVLANATDEEIKEYQRQLKDIKNRTSSDLQRNVFVNRTQFVIISKEINKLKNEMRSLRGMLSDLHTTTSSLRTESSFSTAASDAQSRKNANRSSVADLTALHMSHLQALWKQVEGAQKFLPSVPGRHIVLESRNWVELNAATWKPRRIVHMVLLNDHLLVATVKKRRVDNNAATSGRNAAAAPQIKNVAEKCWGLAELEIHDLTNEARAASATAMRKGVSNAVNIRVGKESYVYQNDDEGKVSDLLRQYKKSSDELRKAMRAETEDHLRRRDSLSMLAGRDPRLLEHSDLISSLSSSATSFTVDGQPRNLRWIESQMDELDENIAHRKFDDAVAAVVNLRILAASLARSNALVSELVSLKTTERAARLADILITDLIANASQKSAVKAVVSWLVKLDYEDRSRESFLQARSNVLKKRTRQVQFDGDVTLYVSQVALVQFTLIKNTVEIYNSCFDYRLASSLVTWAKEHIDAYVALLRRQLEIVEESGSVWNDCLEITRIHSTMLVDCGLDFKELKIAVE